LFLHLIGAIIWCFSMLFDHTRSDDIPYVVIAHNKRCDGLVRGIRCLLCYLGVFGIQAIYGVLFHLRDLIQYRV
jgi:hypothetical protein